MAHLYELNKELQEMFAVDVDENGEVISNFDEAKFDELNVALEDKKRGYVIYNKMTDESISKRKAVIEMYKQEIARLQKANESEDNERKRRNEYFANITGNEKYECEYGKFYYRNSSSVVYDEDEKAFKEWALKNGRNDLLKTEYKVSKTTIGEALARGESVPAHIETKTSISVR